MGGSRRGITNEHLLQQLQWRYATKKFDPQRTIAPEDWATLEEALALTPSSYGLQPWRFVVITDAATKEKLVPASWGQRQVADASHVVVFAVRKNLQPSDVDRYINRIATVHRVSLESLDSFHQLLTEAIQNPNASEWNARQAYIALGNFMTSAALLQIDTCPMEGIQPGKYDEILGLEEEGYTTVVVCPAGYPAADDKYAFMPKVRFEARDLISRVA